MGFIWSTEEQRVRINLSEKASLIMEADMLQFNVSNRSSFMNTVFENFHEQAEASVSLYLNNKKLELENDLVDLATDVEELNKVVLILLKKEESKISKKIKKELRNKYVGNSYRVNNKNLEYLISDDCKEEDYYNHSIGSYLKCIMEEYASLPYIRREEIYFAEKYNIVRNAIATHSVLKVKTAGNRSLYIYPYSISEDGLGTRLYLTGFSQIPDSSITEKRPASFRIPRLQSIKKLKQNGHLTSKEEFDLKQAIKNRTVQFLSGDETTVRVKLTTEGIKKYRSQLHLRPVVDTVLSTEDEYVFHCTEVQAEYYFFKFGKDAEVLEPESLRNRFICLYSKSTIKYTLSNN